MKEKKRYIGLLLVIVMVVGMIPARALADTFTSNVIGPLTLEEEEVDFGEPDPFADLESEGDFVASLHEVRLKGLPYNQRLLAVAETQLGYTESDVNFVVKEDEATGKKAKFGITRYGQWYGLPYEDWCAMFISFCLHYGQVPNYLMPADSGAFTWVNRLQSMGLFRWRSEYTPKPGDLIFFDFDLSGQSDHVGIVSSLYTVDGVAMVETIEGNHSKTVEKFSYPLISLEIQGYGVMSEEIPADELESTITTEYVSGEDTYRVTMTYTADALIPANAVLVVSEILPGTPEYDAYVAESAGALGWEEGSVSDAKVLDISVFADGVEVQPAAPVTVEMVLVDQPAEDWNVVHFGQESAQVLESTAEGDAVSFATDGFSIFVFAKSKLEKTLVASDGNTYNITLTYDPDKAGIPENAELIVTEILQEVSEDPDTSSEYDEYLSKAEGALEKNQRVTFARFFDITIMADGQEIQPATPVEVKIELANEELTSEETEDVKAVHFSSEGEVTALDTTRDSQTVTFSADGFSVYGVVATETLTALYITAEGETYTITVTYDDTAEIPEGATLEVSELANDSEEYTNYVEQAAKALAVGDEIPAVNSARLFDISIMADGQKVEPKAPVEVKIEYVDPESLTEMSEVGAVHFKDILDEEEAQPEVLEIEVQGEEGKVDGVSFTTDSFSVYAVVIIDKESGTFVFEDERYIITISYTREANLPLGTRMTVREVEFDTDEYWTLWDQTIEKLNEGVVWNSDGSDPDPRKGLTDAAFFDVTFSSNGEIVEPAVPVKVDIRYKDTGIIAPAGEKAGAVHIDGDTVELIDDVEVQYSECDPVTQQYYVGGASDAQRYSYEQEHFSITGTYVTGEYIDPDMVLFSTSAPIYTDTEAMKAELEAAKVALKAEGTVRAVGESETPKPASSKKLQDNGDGTYTLSLSVTGKAQSEQTVEVVKSNVIIVMDRSNSMTNNNTYVAYTYDASTYSSGTYYYRNTSGNNYSRVYYRNGAWRTSNSNNGTVHNGPVYMRMNRLDAEQYALDSVVQSLLSNNTPGDPDLNDVIEISVTSFNLRSPGLNASNQVITDVIDSTDYATIMATINNDGAHQSTNWDEALQHAKSLADNWKTSEPGEQVFIIFLTDGEPTANRNTTSGYTTDYWTHWSYADESAKAIVDAGYEFYSIYTYGNNNTYINYLNNLTRSAHGIGTYTRNNFGNTNTYHDNFFNATDTSELVEAFNAIVDHINNSLGLAGVSIEDGIATDVTHTVLSYPVGGGVVSGVTYSKSGGTTSGFTVNVGGDGTPVYTINGSTSNGTTTTVNYDKIVEGTNPVTTTPATATVYTAGEDTYLMPMATMTGGDLAWDLAPLGMLENNATYTISFTVWPDQDAYDYVSNLNNGLAFWNENTQVPVYASDGTTVLYYTHGVDGMPNIVKYPSGTFAALTNTHQDLKYYVYENEVHDDGSTETTYTPGEPVVMPAPNPMRLETSGAKITKKWNAELQMVQLARLLYNTRTGDSWEKTIPFAVKKDGEDYKTVTLGWNDNAYDWAESAEELITVTDNGNTFNLGTMWQEDFSLATGIMLSEDKMAAHGLDTSKYPSGTYNGTTYYLLEKGHTYEVDEPDLGTYNFDMETRVYHPMLVNGTLMNVTFTVSGKTLTITDSKEMNDGIRIDNTLRGGINLKKNVTETINGVSRKINSNEKFEFTITLNNDAAPFSGDQIPWYGVNGNYYHDADGNYIAESVSGDTDGDGLEDDGNILMPSNGNKTASVTLKITNRDTVRIANVPAGTIYTVTETAKDGYELVKIEKEIVIDGETEDHEERTSVNTMDGEIVSNRENNITFTNDTKSYDVKLRKVDENDARLAGATFKVYSDEACKTVARDKDGNEIAELTSADNDDVMIGTFTPGTYYLKETAAPTDYKAISDPIPFTIVRNENGSATVTSSNSAVSIVLVDNVNVIIVKNSPVTVDITIRKINENGDSLTGSIFTLRRAGESTGTTIDLSENAEFIVKNVTSGTYTLTETQAPNGYVIQSSSVTFKVDASAAELEEAEPAEGSGEGETTEVKPIIYEINPGDIARVASDDPKVLEIINQPGVELPETGGIGTDVFAAIGGLMALFAGAVLVLRRKRRANEA